MNPLVQLRICAAALLLAAFAGCEKERAPQPAAETEGETAEVSRTDEAPAQQPVEIAVVPTKHPPVPSEDEEELPLAEPELSVVMEGDKITISGALKSQLQQERIVEIMTREFPDHEIESDLRVEYHRIAVGWGNRVAESFLVPFFKEAKSPRMSYRERVLTLGGRVADARRHRILTEMAIDTFSGDSTEDIDNQIETEP